ncbi:ferritin-like domain-containing protein [Confluentibacter citreus]|uniref:ferritin-like domain-containing protein n=1 Tax=Confluentibacter citreus TaxID=2007307 RepID=UPI000C2825DF|nr:PA2169 family four-helix-bundle protein [Confluentibacter citreus]
MNTYTETIGNKLNDLLEKTYDAEKGFRKAAENTEHTYLKNYFQRKAQQRYAFGQELKAEIVSFGEDVQKEGSFAGAAHRTWMDVKALFSSDNDESMLEEAIRGEKAALEEYNDILNETSLPFSTQGVILKQREAIANDLNTIKKLEDIH